MIVFGTDDSALDATAQAFVTEALRYALSLRFSRRDNGPKEQ